MLNETQRERIANRLSGELPDITDAQKEQIGNFVFNLAALPIGHDTDFLLDRFDSDECKVEPMRTVASICLQELASNN